MNFLEILGCIFIGLLVLAAIGAIIDHKPKPLPRPSEDLPLNKPLWPTRQRRCYACQHFAPEAIEVKTFKGPYFFHLACLRRLVCRAELEPDLYLETPEEREFFAACQIHLILHEAPKD